MRKIRKNVEEREKGKRAREGREKEKRKGRREG